MRTRLFVFTGLIVAYLAPDYFRRAPTPPSEPPARYYVNGQPVLDDPNPAADPDRGPEEKAARTAHRAALNGLYAAFDHPWSAMCALEQRIPPSRL